MINPALSLTKNSTPRATSLVAPRRPTGIWSTIFSSTGADAETPKQAIKLEIYLGNPTGPLAAKKLQLNQASVITTDWGKLVHGEPVIFCCCGISR